jgi:glycosyltransferase involved in cell wall biosynthesis
MFDPNEMDYGDTPASESRAARSYIPAETGLEPWVSIVTPFFEGNDAFRQTHASLLRQTFQNWEWIIVNDASEGAEALALLNEFRDSDPRINVIDLATNSGRSAARNIGIARARCDFIYSLDHDDLLEPTAIEKCLWCLISNPQYGFVNGWSVGFGAQEYLWDRGFECGEEFLKQNLVTGRALFRRATLKATEGFDDTFVEGYEDWDLWLRCADNGIWGFTIPEYLDWFRRHDPPASWEAPGQAEAFGERMKVRYPELFAKASIRVPRAFRGIQSSNGSKSPLLVRNPLTPGPKRILIALTTAGTEAAESHFIPLAQSLAIQGWQVSVVALHESSESRGLTEYFGRCGPDVHVLANFLPGTDCPGFMEYLLQSRDPEVVIIEQSDFGAALLSFLRPINPSPFYFCFSLNGPDQHELWAPSMVEKMPQVADATVQSVKLADLRTFKANPEPTPEEIESGLGISLEIQVPLGVDTTHWQPDHTLGHGMRAEFAAAPGELVIAFWNEYAGFQDINDLANVLFELEKRGTPFKAVIWTSSAHLQWLLQFLETHKIEHRALLLEKSHPSTLRRVLLAGDVFLHLGLKGATSTALFAMASGLPVVCPEGSPVAFLVENSCGHLTESEADRGHIESCANFLEKLSQDENYRHRISQAARKEIAGQYALKGLGQSVESSLLSLRERAHRQPDQAVEEQNRLDLVACCDLAPMLYRTSQACDRSERLLLEFMHLLSLTERNSNAATGPETAQESDARVEDPENAAGYQSIESVRAKFGKLQAATAELAAEHHEHSNSTAADIGAFETSAPERTLQDALRLGLSASRRSLSLAAEGLATRQRELESRIESLERGDTIHSDL